MTYYAKLRNRFLAAFIDFIILNSVCATYLFTFGEPKGDGNYALEGAAVLPIFGLWFLYFPVVESIVGQTIGKKITGIRVVTLSGKDVPFVNAVLRRLFDVVDMFFFGLVAAVVIKSSDKGQRVGDLVARTIVIKDVVEACNQCREKFSLSPSEIAAGTFTCPNVIARIRLGKMNVLVIPAFWTISINSLEKILIKSADPLNPQRTIYGSFHDEYKRL